MTPLEQKIYQASKYSLMFLITALIVFAILVHAPSGNSSPLTTSPFNTETVEGWLTDRVASSIIGGLIGSVVGNSLLIVLWRKYIK